MRQPKIVDINKKRLTKRERAHRKIMEDRVFQIGRDQLEIPPDFLSEEAKVEYMRVVEEAGKIGLLDNLDRAIVTMYAEAWGQYAEEAKRIKEYGTVIKTDSGVKTSPCLAVASKAKDTIFKCSTKLGFAATDRLKLTIPSQPEKTQNKFLKFLDA